MCIQDEGQFVLAKSEWYAPLCDADMSEVIDLLSELQRVTYLQLEHVDLEWDSKRVVDFLLSNKIDMTEFDCVLSSVEILLTLISETPTYILLGGVPMRQLTLLQE